MQKAVFLDLDDTLENWKPAREAIKKKISDEVKTRFGIGKKRFLETFHNVEYSFVGKSLNPGDYNRKKWFRKVFRRLKINVTDNDLVQLEKLYWQAGLAKIKTNPGVIDFLKKVKCRKIMVTDSDGDLDNHIKNKKISLLEIRKYFDMIITSNDTGRNKPDKKLWKVALKKFSLNPKECIMIGDKPEMDLRPTKEMGFTTVWMKSGKWSSMRKGKKFKYVDYEITNFSQLKGLICQKKTR